MRLDKLTARMVYIIDEGSTFDAPLDRVWKYLSSQDHRHPSAKVLNREVVGNAVVITSERNIMGKTTLVKVKNTLYPPIGMVQETLEGPLAGSRSFLYYIPKGDKTGVTVVGEYVMNGVTDDQTVRNAVSAMGQTSFDEDNSNLSHD
jgi:hypothetical protein